MLPGRITLSTLRDKHMAYRAYFMFDRRKYWKCPLMLSFITTQCWDPGNGSARIWYKTFYETYGEKDSKKIKEYLRRTGMIMYDNNDYKKGEYTRAYYCDAPENDAQYFFCPELTNQMEKTHASNIDGFMRTARPGMQWVIETILHHTEFGIGVDAALLALEGQTKEDKDGRIVDVYRWNILMMARLEGVQPWSPSIGAKGGRLFHPITGMKGSIREFIIIDGGPTVQLDVKSCFPYLCLNLYASDCAEKQKYYQRLQDGFYEWVISLAPERFAGLEGDQLRDEAKKHVFSNILFSKKGQHRVEWLWRPFCLEFPKLSAAIAEADSLAATLQQTESTAIFDVVELLMKDGIRCITVHDCLIVPDEHAETARLLLGQRLYEATGYNAEIKQSGGGGCEAAAERSGSTAIDGGTGVYYTSSVDSAMDSTLQPFDYPTDNWTDTEKTCMAEDFQKVVWRVTHGKWVGIRTEAKRLSIDDDYLEGLLWCVYHAKVEDREWLPEWTLQLQLNKNHRRFRIDHKND